MKMTKVIENKQMLDYITRAIDELEPSPVGRQVLHTAIVSSYLIEQKELVLLRALELAVRDVG